MHPVHPPAERICENRFDPWVSGFSRDDKGAPWNLDLSVGWNSANCSMAEGPPLRISSVSQFQCVEHEVTIAVPGGHATMVRNVLQRSARQNKIVKSFSLKILTLPPFLFAVPIWSLCFLLVKMNYLNKLATLKAHGFGLCRTNYRSSWGLLCHYSTPEGFFSTVLAWCRTGKPFTLLVRTLKAKRLL